MHTFSRHSLQRIVERGFSKESILSIINKETDVVVYPSTRDRDIDLYFGKAGAKHLLVVYNRKTGTIVTVRNMRQKEIDVYTEVMKHEKK
jgi:hypothetical protein